MADAAVVALVLEKLTALVAENARLFIGVADEIEEITRELKRMQLFLRDADSVNDCKHLSVRHWLKEIRRLAYQVEDIVETFAVEYASSSRRRGLKNILKRIACIVCEAKFVRDLGLEIAKVKADISTITTSVQRYDAKAIGAGESFVAGNENQWLGRQTYAHQVEQHFVGMEEDMKKLLSLVLDDNDGKAHPVISMWGMGGLGKTTLARKIYKHRDVQRRFRCSAWVCITQNAQFKVILQDILKQFAPEGMREVNFMGTRELVQQIYQVQKAKKCLIVLDDIWKLEDWKSLVAAFPIAEGDSKIVITTRNQKIAEIGFAYALKCLTETESWELLQKIASSGKNVQGNLYSHLLYILVAKLVSFFPHEFVSTFKRKVMNAVTASFLFTNSFLDFKIEQEMELVGTQMVRKCGGLPLAISVLGGILKDKNSLSEWEMVNKYVSSYLSNAEEDEQGGAVARVLSLSYDDLPYYLKPCFLYLGSYREDELIEVGTLYMLWEAEGMILPQHLVRSDQRSVDIAERYLEELARRSMVQVKPHQTAVPSKYHKCSVHDMMRDLCLEKGREEEFIRVINFRGRRQSLLDPSTSANPPCRLVIHMDVDVQNVSCKTSTKAQVRGQQLRSLRCLNLNGSRARDMIWPEGILSLEDSKSLRVLQFEGYDFQRKKLPINFGKSIHLRYLQIKNCKLDELPSSVAKLPFLHTLYVQVNNAIKVPNVLWKMKKLKRLYLFTNGRCTVGNQRLRLHGLNELETLCGFDSRTYKISDLANLLNLQHLLAKVHDNNSLHSIIDYINTSGLKLKVTGVTIEDGCVFVGLNKWYALLRKVLMCDNLNYLTISVKLRKFPRYEPGMLQNLVALGLTKNKIDEDCIATLEMLPQLRLLSLAADSYVGTEMSFHEWGFPQLRILRLLKLSNLESWRVEKGAMPKLNCVMIMGCLKLEMIPDGLKSVVSLTELIICEMPETFCNRIQKRDGKKGDDYDKIEHISSISFDRPPGFCYDLFVSHM